MEPSQRAITRGEFLRIVGGAGLALSGVGALAACSNTTTAASSSSGGLPAGPNGIPLARPGNPVTLPLYEDNPAIASDLAPETNATLNLLMQPDYINEEVLNDFAKQYNCKVVQTVVQSIDQQVAKLSVGIDADVVVVTPDRLAALVAGKLIQPLNQDYIPNLTDNVWQNFHSPFYDTGARYSVPYSVYTYGIGWRTDHITEDIPALENPWDIFWQSEKYGSKVGLPASYRFMISTGLFHDDIYDVNTENKNQINSAVQALKELDFAKVDINEYQTIATGLSWLHTAFSGSLVCGWLYFRPDNLRATDLAYWTPEDDDKRLVTNDCWHVCGKAKNPVLAHQFINYMLDTDVAKKNFIGFTGFQPPITEITGESLIEDGTLPSNLKNCIVRPEDFAVKSPQSMTLTTQGQALWQNGYSEIVAGA